MSKLLVLIQGGLGKHVMFTALAPYIRKKYEKLYVVSAYPDVLKACSYVTNSFPIGQANLYRELILDGQCEIMMFDPYDVPEFIRKEIHLFDAWLKLLPEGIPEPDGIPTPVLDNIESMFPTLTKTAEEISSKGPYMLVQFTGGRSPLMEGGETQPAVSDATEPVKRNYVALAAELIGRLKEKYPDVRIINFALASELSLPGTEIYKIPYLAYTLLAKKASKVICIDSSLQHLVSGYCNDVTVIWRETRPKHFGYPCNKNVVAEGAPACVFSQPYFRPLGASPIEVPTPTVAEVMSMVDKEVGMPKIA